MSSSSATYRRRLPTNCKCGFSLVKRVSWTDLNLGRRFLNRHNSNISNPWYKYQMFEVYVTQNPDERFLYVEHLRAQDQLERLQIEHDGLVSKFKQSKKRLQLVVEPLPLLLVPPLEPPLLLEPPLKPPMLVEALLLAADVACNGIVLEPALVFETGVAYDGIVLEPDGVGGGGIVLEPNGIGGVGIVFELDGVEGGVIMFC
ncbi:hypothetical protein Tco_0979546 [Tanacetum coccineum]